MPYREAPRAEAYAVACFYCGSIVQAGKCPSCLADMQRGDGPTPVACRRCGGALARNSIGHGCAACGGVFVGGVSWDAIVDALRTGGSVDVSAIVPPPPGSPKPDFVKPVACVSCGGPTERVPFGARSGILVDVCARHGIWFDTGEIVPVFEFVRRLWKENDGHLLTPEQRRERAEIQEFHRVKNELDKRAADEREEVEEIIRRSAV